MGWSFCFFRNFFGVDCPGCGLTHSIIALFQGNFHQSLYWHPMGVLVVLWFLNLWWWRHFRLSKKGSLWISHGLLLGFLVPWVVKLII